MYHHILTLSYIQMDLPNYNKMQKESKKSPDELRSLMKKKNILPPRSFTERPLNISATSVYNKYIVPLELEGGKLPLYKVAVYHLLTPRGRYHYLVMRISWNCIMDDWL